MATEDKPAKWTKVHSGLDAVEQEYFRQLWSYGSGAMTLHGDGSKTLLDLANPPDEAKAALEKFFNVPLVEAKDKTLLDLARGRAEPFDPKKHWHAINPLWAWVIETQKETDARMYAECRKAAEEELDARDHCMCGEPMDTHEDGWRGHSPVSRHDYTNETNAIMEDIGWEGGEDDEGDTGC